MPLGAPYFMGSASTSGVTATSLTVGHATTAGDLIVVAADSDYNGNTISTVTDSAGNTYTQATQHYYPNPSAAIYYAQNTAALTTANTITVTWAVNSDANMTVIGCSGVSPSGALDQRASQWTSATNLSLVTPKLTSSSEFAVVFFSSRSGQGAPTLTGDWTSVASFQGAVNTHFDNTAWKIVSASDPVTATASTGVSGFGLTGILVTFRAQVLYTGTLSCGGSFTGTPVQGVTGTGVLNTGGSMLGPLELAPAPPPSPPVFAAGHTPVPTDFAGWVQGGFRYCTEQIMFRAEQTSGQSVSAATWTVLGYDTVTEDPFQGWSAAGTGSQPPYSWLAPFTAWYRVTFKYSTTGASAWQDAGIGVSGVNPTYETGGVLNPAGVPGGAGCSFLVPLIGDADYIQFLAWSSAGVTTDTTTPGRRPFVEITPVQTDLLPSSS